MIFRGFGDKLLPLEFYVAKGRNPALASLRFKKKKRGKGGFMGQIQSNHRK